MAAYREYPVTNIQVLLLFQKLEGFASVISLRHSKGTALDQKTTLENDSLHFSGNILPYGTNQVSFCFV